ncbi:glycohydrolase toxin TNT-related protein [Saccharopolyspora griseoalba]|uniref:Glycohydrolase toxin TNT-related protein n=1 Tax=Saccharopolyspora griseoalba TaxID=1431848 RepID=A0ABW2LJZ5_9PSEU
MSRPTAISPEEQEQIARKIGVLLLQGAPEDWQEITVEYRATGEYTDLLGEMSAQDGSSRRLEPPDELREIFERLREGMYRPDVGTWLSALYVVERPSSYRIDINFDTEPQWQRSLPRAAYVDELRRYPRAEENIPDWMRERIEGAEPEAEVPDSPAGVSAEPAAEPAAEQADGFRFANVFDGVDDEGRPVVAERRPVPGDEVSALRQYLESAPVVLSARENEEDLLASDRDRSVPSSWHTDGTWVWAGAVAYYLAQYGLPPETALVDHARSRGFQLGEVDDATRDAVVRELTEQPADEGQAEEPQQDDLAESSVEEAEIDEQLADVPAEVPAATGSRHVLDSSDEVPDTQAVLAELHDRLTGYRVDSSEYRIGSTAEGARCLVQDGEDWAVVGDGEDVRFARVDHAASFLLGRLLLDLPVAEGTAASAAPADPVVESTTAPEPAVEVPEPAAEIEDAEPTAAQDEPVVQEIAEPQSPAEPELPQRGAPQEPAAELPQRSEPASDLPKRTPQEPMPKPSSSGPSTGGNPLFTANQEPGAPVPEPPAAEAPQQPPMDRPLPPQAPPSPPAGQPAQPPNGAAPGAGELPKRQPRRDSGAPVPPPGAPGAQGGQPQGGPAQGGQAQGGQAQQGGPARPAPNAPGATGPNRQGPPPAPPRPPQGGQPPAGQPQQPPQTQGQPAQQGQQIQPLNGEPPLTLYRDRRIVMLQPGTELDRFGEPNGNVLYTARTPYTHRSLPPQWSNRAYVAYRVQRPIQALRGTAVPWFEQPGGGTAFVLPGAVSDLLADGTLAEMPANERPPME